MNIRYCAGIKIACMALLIYTILAGLFALFGPRRMADYPCRIDEMAEGCYHYPTRGYDNAASLPRIEVLLTTRCAGVSGGGCNYQQSQTDTLNVKNNLMPLKFERVGEDLKVNGKILKTDQAFRRVNPLHFNPWVVLFVEFKNLGLLIDCDAIDQDKKLIVFGSYGSGYSIVKGLIFLLISIIPLVFLKKSSATIAKQEEL